MSTDHSLTSHAGMTIRTYRVNTETGEREDFTATVVVPPDTNIPAEPLRYGPCKCPRCTQGPRPAQETS